MMNITRDKATQFHALHHGESPLLLSNAWDAASARIVEAAGVSAIATTSAGISWASGLPDGDYLGRSRAVAVAESIIGASELPVTADIEGGYADTAYGVSETVKAFLDVGVVGINIEDGDRSADDAGNRIAMAKKAADSAGVALFVNARTDVFLKEAGPDEDRVSHAVSRAARFVDAGADGIFVPGATEIDTVAALVERIDAPLNLMAGPGAPTVQALAALGVARVSLGSAVAQAAYAVVKNATAELLTSGSYSRLEDSLDYSSLNGLASMNHSADQ